MIICSRITTHVDQPQKNNNIILFTLHGEKQITYPNDSEYETNTYIKWFFDISKNNTFEFPLETHLTYPALYYQITHDLHIDLNNSVCVSRTNVADKLETSLSKYGLNQNEMNNLIISIINKLTKKYFVFQIIGSYQTKHNMIHFNDVIYDNTCELRLTPYPDFVLRVIVMYSETNQYIKCNELQKLPFYYIPNNREKYWYVECGYSNTHDLE